MLKLQMRSCDPITESKLIFCILLARVVQHIPLQPIKKWWGYGWKSCSCYKVHSYNTVAT